MSFVYQVIELILAENDSHFLERIHFIRAIEDGTYHVDLSLCIIPAQAAGHRISILAVLSGRPLTRFPL